jgi:hypothetical protein
MRLQEATFASVTEATAECAADVEAAQFALGFPTFPPAEESDDIPREPDGDEEMVPLLESETVEEFLSVTSSVGSDEVISEFAETHMGRNYDVYLCKERGYPVVIHRGTKATYRSVGRRVEQAGGVSELA